MAGSVGHQLTYRLLFWQINIMWHKKVAEIRRWRQLKILSRTLSISFTRTLSLARTLSPLSPVPIGSIGRHFFHFFCFVSRPRVKSWSSRGWKKSRALKALARSLSLSLPSSFNAHMSLCQAHALLLFSLSILILCHTLYAILCHAHTHPHSMHPHIFYHSAHSDVCGRERGNKEGESAARESWCMFTEEELYSFVR